MTDTVKIHPVILCGGSGTRLWPLSRKSYPKQFAKLLGEKSLFQSSAQLLLGDQFEAPLVVTGDPFRFIVTEQLAAIEKAAQAVLIEPEGRNTAPAILAAALWLEARDPDAVMLVLASDHVIPDAEAFQRAALSALPRAIAGDLVTFGITPTRPETGYGYLELADATKSSSNTPLDLKRFVEKPDHAAASGMIEQGNFLWNAGIFLLTARAVRKAFQENAPEMLELVSQAVEGAETDLGFTRLAPAPWGKCESISIDYAIMEKSENLAVMPYDGKWSDLGGWDAVWRESGPDEQGNVASPGATAIDCENSLLRSENDNLEIVGIGLRNTIAIAMGDSVLVADISQSQRVKEAVEALKAKGAVQAEAFPVDHRPWGWFESIALGVRFQVKRIVVHPGAALSLQSHHHRAEHWIVVEGTAKVTINDVVSLVSENESVYIPLGATHRLENPGKLPMVLIEVQTGSYLGEDDIVRYEDVYARK